MTTLAQSQKAVSYACLILQDERMPVTAENILKITDAAGVKIERIWAEMFEKTFKGKDIGDFLTRISPGAAPVQTEAAPAPKEQEKKKEESEESDEEMGFGLFD
ncbi:MAG: 60S acidic ribosomal protein P1 [Amphiamblys sp. WSBS2006]|nr:MAG: 60S acidic ribosomal protein P1 [Amphiamblys sp. WSBS2006]